MTTVPPASEASRVISTAKMKEYRGGVVDPADDDSADAADAADEGVYEEAWFRLDPIDLKIIIPILAKSIESLPRDEKVIVGQVIGCMALALSRSEKQELRDGIAGRDTSALLRAMKRMPGQKKHHRPRHQKEDAPKANRDDNQ